VSAKKAVVLFDIDGTLMRGAGSHHKEALIEGIGRVTGRTASFEGVDTAGKLDRDLIAGLLAAAGCPRSDIDFALEQIVLECQNAYCANCAADLSRFVLKGVRETLAGLHEAGAALGLVTGNLSKIGWRKMELSGLRGYFSFGAFSEDGTTRADVARTAEQRARQVHGLASDIPVSLIGDHRNDIEAAKANGFRAVAVASGVMSAKDLSAFRPDILLDTLADLDIRELLPK
jgi:phosphoglycolate phosphatase-like HAD superfamily hydrolase